MPDAVLQTSVVRGIRAHSVTIRILGDTLPQLLQINIYKYIRMAALPTLLVTEAMLNIIICHLLSLMFAPSPPWRLHTCTRE